MKYPNPYDRSFGGSTTFSTGTFFVSTVMEAQNFGIIKSFNYYVKLDANSPGAILETQPRTESRNVPTGP